MAQRWSRADVVVVGAGPAGLPAAAVCADAGLSVVLVDQAPQPGGSYYRRRPGFGPAHPWAAFDRMERRWDRAVATGLGCPRFEHHVVGVEPHDGGWLTWLRRGDRHAGDIEGVWAPRVVIATGAHDRQVPFPGWDLPGVLSGGALQTLIKGSGVAPGKRVAVAGSGPFLLVVAQSALRAGMQVALVLEAARPTTAVRGPGVGAGLARGWRKSGQLAGFVRDLARARVPYRTGVRVVRAEPDGSGDRLRTVVLAQIDRQWRAIPGTEEALPVDVLAVGYGFTAQLDLAAATGADIVAASDGDWRVVVDDYQRTTVGSVLAAGEVTGIAGADAAFAEGCLAGISIVVDAGARRPDARFVMAMKRQRRAAHSAAQALNAVFATQDGWIDDLAPQTLVCRCEEVSAQAVQRAILVDGAADIRSVKMLTRAGMGWCQGRMCEYAVGRLCATSGMRGDPAPSRRPVVSPVTLGALAALAPGASDA